MTTTSSEIRAILNTQVATVSGVTGMLKENTAYDATGGQTGFVRLTLLPAQTDIDTIGVRPTLKLQGLYQVDCFGQTGTGTAAAQALADSIAAAFAPQLLTDGTNNVTIEVATVMTAQVFNKYYFVPVQVRWSCYSM